MPKLMLLSAALLTAIFVACGGGEEALSPAENVPPEIAAAVAFYIANTGLGGDANFILAEPPECQPTSRRLPALGDGLDGTYVLEPLLHGFVCILRERTSIGENEAKVTVSLFPTDVSWELTLERVVGGWQVTGVKAGGG